MLKTKCISFCRGTSVSYYIIEHFIFPCDFIYCVVLLIAIFSPGMIITIKHRKELVVNRSIKREYNLEKWSHEQRMPFKTIHSHERTKPKNKNKMAGILFDSLVYYFGVRPHFCMFSNRTRRGSMT